MITLHRSLAFKHFALDRSSCFRTAVCISRARKMKAVMVRYAGDFVVLCGQGRVAEVCRRLKLRLERTRSGCGHKPRSSPDSVTVTET